MYIKLEKDKIKLEYRNINDKFESLGVIRGERKMRGEY